MLLTMRLPGRYHEKLNVHVAVGSTKKLDANFPVSQFFISVSNFVLGKSLAGKNSAIMSFILGYIFFG
jgi:hypothetical protein